MIPDGVLHEPTVDDSVLRPTHVEVDHGALAHNYRTLCAHVGRPVMPVLKANAYGHGLVEVARTLEAEGAPVFGLAFVEEGMRLRRAGIHTPILVLGGVLGDQIPLYLQHDLMPTASSPDKLRAIDAAAAARGVRARVHVKFDTGMERLGVHWYHAHKLLDEIPRARHVEVVGVFSHLASSDEADRTYTNTQRERFDEVVDGFRVRGLPTPVRHLANSGAVLQHPDTWYDLVRPGILSYGVFPSADVPRTLPVRPALRWVSKVVFFKVVRAGDPVSYGSTWAPTVDTRVVTVPVGYGDGYFRALSNRARVRIGGRDLPVVGRVCMDQLLVDLGPDGTAYNGDEVVLLGDGVTAEDLAGWAGTIPYEVLTNVNTRVPRVHVGPG
jgi:alanine racemase